MGVRSWLGLPEASNPVLDAALTRVREAEAHVELLTESLADVERAMDDTGWQRLTSQATEEFSRRGLQRAAEIARAYAVMHPLIKRGLGIRQAYVFGQGVTISCAANGTGGTQDINSLVQSSIDDPGNVSAVFGGQAREELERALGTDGNLFFAGFTSPRTGFVQWRVIPFDEVQSVITNPEDASEPWYYERQWTETRLDPTSWVTQTAQHTAYYPALIYRPRTRPKTINGHPVMWDAPVHHMAVNRLTGWSFGIGDAYATLTDARLYRDFLIDWANLVKSLSQFAWRATTGKPGRAQRMRQALARRPTIAGPDGNPNNVGATAVLDEATTLEAIPKHGATIDSESGRPLAAMVAAALDIPVTTLLADPGQTGARAVAETLNLPTRLAMQQRQEAWAETYRAMLAYTIRAAVRAPQGPLQGTITLDAHTGREALTLAGDTDPSIIVEFPSLEEGIPVAELIDAIVKADSTDTMPKVETLRLILRTLSVPDADQIIADVTDADGNLIPAGVTAGVAAVDAYRRGVDPATVV